MDHDPTPGPCAAAATREEARLTTTDRRRKLHLDYNYDYPQPGLLRVSTAAGPVVEVRIPINLLTELIIGRCIEVEGTVW